MEYCIADIHGYYDLFCRLMDKIHFSDNDRLYVLGDMIDKGPDSIRLIKLLFSMQNVVCIAGNHEYDFLKFYRGLMKQTENYDSVLDQLKKYFSDGELLGWDIVDQLDMLPFYVETQAFIGVHAGIPVSNNVLLPFDKVTCEQFVYDRRFKDPDVLPNGGKCVLFGHTPTRYLKGKDEIIFYPRPTVKANGNKISDYYKVHLDTGSWLGGVMGCVCIDTCECFYVRKFQ